MAPPSCLGSLLGGPSSTRSSPSPLSLLYRLFLLLVSFRFLLKLALVHILSLFPVCRSCLSDSPLCLPFSHIVLLLFLIYSSLLYRLFPCGCISF
jgi:hypothetical protein